MEKFAKLFESDELGQILVKKEENEEGEPIVTFYIDPDVYAFGICNTSMGFNDTDSGWDARDKFFNEINLQGAVKHGLALKKTLRDFC